MRARTGVGGDPGGRPRKTPRRGTRGLPFCFGPPPGPRRAPRGRAIVRPCRGDLRLPDRRGLAARGLRRWPRLRAPDGAWRAAAVDDVRRETPVPLASGRAASSASPSCRSCTSRHHGTPAALFAPTRTAAESSTPSPIALRGACLQKRGPGWPGGHRRRHERRPVAALGRAAPPSARETPAQPPLRGFRCPSLHRPAPVAPSPTRPSLRRASGSRFAGSPGPSPGIDSPRRRHRGATPKADRLAAAITVRPPRHGHLGYVGYLSQPHVRYTAD
jgi:hypothetical protein